MKVIRIYILVCIMAAGLASCNKDPKKTSDAPASEFRLVNIHYENSGGEKGVTHLYYDPEGMNYMAIWHLEDSSRSSVNYHFYDTAGRMAMKSREFSDDLRSVQQFEYDGEGNLAWENFNRSDSVMGLVNYIYNEDGRLEHANCRGLNGWYHGRIEYTWKGDRKTGADLVRDSIKIGSIEYEYDEKRLVLEHWDFNGNWSQTFRYDYQEEAPQTFTSSNVFIRESPWFRVSSEYYENNGESGGPSHYSYDESGKLISKEFIRSDGLTTLTTYEFDSTGLLDLSHREYGDGRQTEFLYWYSVERKLLVRTFQWSDGASGSETYRYEDGRLVRGEYMNVEGWLNGTLDFEHDENGILRSAAFTGKDGSTASLDFSYDLNFNLIQINWEFSSGHTQTYFFRYETN